MCGSNQFYASSYSRGWQIPSLHRRVTINCQNDAIITSAIEIMFSSAIASQLLCLFVSRITENCSDILTCVANKISKLLSTQSIAKPCGSCYAALVCTVKLWISWKPCTRTDIVVSVPTACCPIGLQLVVASGRAVEWRLTCS